MFVDNSRAEYRDGVKYVYFEAYSSETPSPMPTAADIPGYTSDYTIMPGSTIYVVGSGTLYMANENQQFVEQ